MERLPRPFAQSRRWLAVLGRAGASFCFRPGAAGLLARVVVPQSHSQPRVTRPPVWEFAWMPIRNASVHVYQISGTSKQDLCVVAAFQTLLVCVKLSMTYWVAWELRHCVFCNLYVTDYNLTLIDIGADGTAQNCQQKLSSAIILRFGDMVAAERFWWGSAPLVNFCTDPLRAISTERQANYVLC